MENTDVIVPVHAYKTNTKWLFYLP